MPINSGVPVGKTRAGALIGLVKIAIVGSVLMQLGLLSSRAQAVPEAVEAARFATVKLLDTSGKRLGEEETNAEKYEYSPTPIIKRSWIEHPWNPVPGIKPHVNRGWLVLSATSITAAYLDTISTIQIENLTHGRYGKSEANPL